MDTGNSDSVAKRCRWQDAVKTPWCAETSASPVGVMCQNWREPCRRVSSGVAGHSEAGSRADFTLAMVGEHPLWASERPRATASARSGRSPVYEAQVTRRARRGEASTSGSLAVVEPKQPAEALSASDTAFLSAGLLVSDDELAAQALVMSLAMIMSDERG